MRNDNRLFLYENKIDLVVEAGNLYVDNRNMNLRKQVAHKGVTNEITFTVRDRDRRPQNVQGTQMFVHIVHPRTGRRLVSRELERKSDVGIVKLYLTESDLNGIPAGLYVGVVTRNTMQAGDLPVYTDQNNNITFDIEITDQAFVTPAPTQTTSNFVKLSTDIINGENIWVSDLLLGNVKYNHAHPNHSQVLKLDDFTGDIYIQASCYSEVDNTNAESTQWFTVKHLTFTDSTTGPELVNFSVNAEWIRVVYHSVTGSITQVQLRN